MWNLLSRKSIYNLELSVFSSFFPRNRSRSQLFVADGSKKVCVCVLSGAGRGPFLGAEHGRGVPALRREGRLGQQSACVCRQRAQAQRTRSPAAHRRVRRKAENPLQK